VACVDALDLRSSARARIYRGGLYRKTWPRIRLLVSLSSGERKGV
jgi:hypothetical protein